MSLNWALQQPPVRRLPTSTAARHAATGAGAPPSGSRRPDSAAWRGIPPSPRGAQVHISRPAMLWSLVCRSIHRCCGSDPGIRASRRRGGRRRRQACVDGCPGPVERRTPRQGSCPPQGGRRHDRRRHGPGTGRTAGRPGQAGGEAVAGVSTHVAQPKGRTVARSLHGGVSPVRTPLAGDACSSKR